MLEGRRALDLALDLARMPTLAGAMQAQPLPPDTLVVIRIAAGCAETCEEAALATGAPPAAIKEAAVLYLQKILFASGSDSHRILGVRTGAPRSVLREHMRWLMRWLHPDRNPSEWESVFAERVITAWRDVGGRAGPVGEAPNPAEQRSSGLVARNRLPRHRWVAVPLQPDQKTRRMKFRLAAAIVVGSVVALAMLLTPGITPVSRWLASTSADADSSAWEPADRQR